MKEVTQRIVFILLVIVLLTLTPKISVSAAELPMEMPIVYVDPQDAFAAVGTIFNVSVKVFNLTDSFYGTDEEWLPGEPLPPLGSRYNYSLGHMWGFNINFSWDPEILEYVSRLVKTPIEDYPDGVLYSPIIEVQDVINSTAGTYSVTQNSGPFIRGFNCHNKSATVFTITFKVKKAEPCPLHLESVELLLDLILAVEPKVPVIIPHHALDGAFTPVVLTRIISIDVGVLIDAQLHTPLILGEDAIVRVLAANDGTVPNSYNLVVYNDAIPQAMWEGENLSPGEMETYTCTLKAEDVMRGLHEVTAKSTILFRNTTIVDSVTKDFAVITTPLLSVSSPNYIRENETVILNAEKSFHQDPNSQISNYRWSVYEPGGTVPAYEYEGTSVTHTFTRNGTWRIILVARDNWGVTYNPLRNATIPYRKEMLLDVHTGNESSPYDFAYVQTVVLVASIILIAVIGIVIYRIRKKHR